MENTEIQDRIKALEEELILLKANLPKGKTVFTPPEISPVFDKAEKIVSEYFDKLKLNPQEGTISIEDERYILVRASSLSNEFFENFSANFPEKSRDEAFSLAKQFLFDIGHVIGLEDAKKFHEKMHLDDPISKLSAGPVHFAHAGWANVDILPESKPSPDENYFLKYHHPYSFEADSWLKTGRKTNSPICIMNAAYSSGWCEASFGIELTAVEISCRAKGDDCCTFIMAPPSKIQNYLDAENLINKKKEKVEVPYFFERKHLEEKLRKNEEMLKTAQNIAKIGSWEYDLSSKKLTWSEELYRIFEVIPEESENLEHDYFSRLSPEDQIIVGTCFENCAAHGKPYQLEHKIYLKNNKVKSLFCIGTPFYDKEGSINKIYGIAQDITENKNQHEALLANLREKEVLLKEVHHRVKNNLQIISSLLNLQSGFINNKEIESLYTESQHRIKSIASVHELLYQSEDLSQIPFKKYLNKLVGDLLFSFLGTDNKVDVQINTSEKFDIDTSIPLGLLINEIVTNSLKHGIKDVPNPEIYIQIFKTDEKQYTLKIGDNGLGYQVQTKRETPATLGLMLIYELAEQLNGAVEKLEKGFGTHYELQFKTN